MSRDVHEELLDAIYDAFVAGFRRHFIIATIAGLDAGPFRERIEALYDQHIADGCSPDEAEDRIVALLESERPDNPKGLLSAIDPGGPA
jgi:hypothetical protein